MIFKSMLRSSVLGLRTWSIFSTAKQANITFKQHQCSYHAGRTLTSLLKGNEILPNQPSRQCSQQSTKKTEFSSQLMDLQPDMLKKDFVNVPLAHSVNDLVKRLLSLEFASHREKLKLKEEQLIAKVQRHKLDRTSPEVRVAKMTKSIRNFEEHLQKNHKDKANKRWMLLTIDCRNKLLKNLRKTNYDAFEKVCTELGITYTFPQQYYRRETHRTRAKKAFCKMIFMEVQRRKAEKLKKEKEALAQKNLAASPTVPQETAT